MTSSSRVKLAALFLLCLAAVFQAGDVLGMTRPEVSHPRDTGFLGLGAADYACGDCNVILISIDTLRQDHVGAYGYERDTTPHVDRFARDSVRFDQAIAQAPSTLPSHAAIFTSMIPEHHRAFQSMNRPLPDEAVTMAELLFDAGFRTAAFTAGAQMHSKWNLDQGFDIWDEFEGEMTHKSRFSDIVDKARVFLDEHGDEQFFLLLHTYEVHTPYTPPAEYLEMFDPDYRGTLGDEIQMEFIKSIFQGPARQRITEADRRHVVAAYDGEIRSMDDAFGDLVTDLQDRGLYEDSLIIFTSDHGEEFGERGRVGWHSWTLYDELLRVPLLVKMPRSAFAGSEVEDLVQGIDLLPTILDVIGAEREGPFEGSSLVDAILGRRGREAFAVSQRDYRDPQPSSIRTTRWKLYDGMLFDLAADPMERLDVSDQHPWVRASLELNLELARAGMALSNADQIEMSEELREQLRALGYIQ